MGFINRYLVHILIVGLAILLGLIISDYSGMGAIILGAVTLVSLGAIGAYQDMKLEKRLKNIERGIGSH
jgi:uncharacterized membrane protein YqjE